MENLKAIILAAGEGTRMKSKKPKVLHEIMNKSMVEYVIDTAKDSGAEAVCVVVGPLAEQVQAAIQREDVSFALQTERKGTGHAVKMAGDFIEDDAAVVPPDAASFSMLQEQLAKTLEGLAERERKVITLRFGLEDGHPRTLEEVGREFGVTRERIRQIESKTLAKLRHPSRSQKLKDYLED